MPSLGSFGAVWMLVVAGTLPQPANVHGLSDELVSDTAARLQARTRAELAPGVKAAWERILSAAKNSGRLDAQVSGDARQDAYNHLIQELLATREAGAFLRLTPEDQRRYLDVDEDPIAEAIRTERPRLARSFDAAATNPRRVGLLERSGLTDLVSLAVQGSRLVSADDTAVTVNLSAAALLCKACRDKQRPAASRYRAAGALSRLGGSLTFGAKIPEKEITGFSGLPSAENLFDVLVWDVKLRLVGDRDPRSSKWDDIILGELGGLNGIRAITSSHPAVPPGDERTGGPLLAAFHDQIERRYASAARRITGSLQVSVKFSGQHLTEQKGTNKYTGALMLDKGLGPFDGTLNVSYSAVQDVPKPTGLPVTLKQWKVAGGFVGTVWKDVIVPGRGAELAVSAEGLFPADGREVTLDRKIVYKGDVAFKFPLSKTLELPFSVTYTNDPNSLAKKRFVTGRIGINYDFGSLKRLVTEMTGKQEK